jgi:hypothetical protein
MAGGPVALASPAPAPASPRVRWTWLWGLRSDVIWNLLPFWLCGVVAAVIFGARNLGGPRDNPVWNFTVGGHSVHLLSMVMVFYAPLVDAPHLWATIARTYVDPDEWTTRRRLFLLSLLWFAIGPAIILAPYALRAVFPALPAGVETAVWVAWSNFFAFYALFHINKQHWGFISLYKRKNADIADPVENRADSLFFFTAIWLPYGAMLTAPWYKDFDDKPLPGTQVPIFGTTSGALLHAACHVAFVCACVAYVAFQVTRRRAGATRNGPKLVYIATVVPLYYAAFAIHPLLASFWVLITGVGHCSQYHRVVWGYATSKYATKTGDKRSLPSTIFGNPWLYAVLGVVFGIVTLQGEIGGRVAAHLVARVFATDFFSHAFSLGGSADSMSLGVKVAAAFVGAVRLHHFYVDSKIWRVSKSAALAKNLAVQPAS